ncbi:MAG: DUF1425 domain-containing protein [Planctomycetes bacterium]|mgnify:CR=1 FL=1|jgi:uncharacterized protein YcfL|nr:DUF1425 domain-containing protein [Planctomycetota bacterium]MBT4029805.1 DUF1425 domain-containing protein [Planctomycetota bacterium]MBT4559899.1 DUF1425 domain-containing protein [Planctomycetota bacterium]MBT5120183.1 DUF1425 domain-containing protein [Planctomycetota bacterium]MBT7318310.1 DUF1425 domain-containing protein [Planctomycetota bacterium]
MKTLQLTALALVLALGACSSYEAENGSLFGTTTWAGADIDDLINRENGRVFFDKDDLAVYQVELTTSQEDLTVEWRARWFDDQGMEIKDVTRAWRIIHMNPYAATPVRSIAPSMSGVSCRVEVRKHKSLGR